MDRPHPQKTCLQHYKQALKNSWKNSPQTGLPEELLYAAKVPTGGRRQKMKKTKRGGSSSQDGA